MIRQRLLGATFAAILAAGLPATTGAQSEPPTSPEGQDWLLTSWYDEETAETQAVPLEVEPTLRLWEGVASGFAGCNTFSGSYHIDGSDLSFSDEMSVTLAFCDDPAQTVEDAYLAGLGEVDGWTIDAGVLELTDGIGDVILTFERPSALTPGQVAALLTGLAEVEAGLAQLREDLDAVQEDVVAVPVDNFRKRIKALEADNRKLKQRVKDLEQAPTLDPEPEPDPAARDTGFSSGEKVLLKGIPQRISNHCRPLRSSLPRGTRAAVTCTPNTNAVSSVQYYLLEGDAAATAFGADMDAHKVVEATSSKRTCKRGVKSQRHWLSRGWQAEGCYRAGDIAEVRFVDNATDCRKLKVSGKTLASPAVYIELHGKNKDIARVHDWATRNPPAGSSQRTSLTQPIPSRLGASNACPT